MVADDASVHVIDHDSRRRAEISRDVIARGAHAEIYEDAGEFLHVLPAKGLVLLVEHPERNALDDFLRAARERGRYYPVSMYSDAPRPELVVRAMREGAIDYLCWPFAANLLESALRRLAEEGERRHRTQAIRAEAKSLVGQLTQRERDVLVSLLNGNSNKQIAAELALSPRTVEIYRKNVMRKFDVRSASEAVRIGIYADLWDVSPA
ncbi:LuxR C-terminal-related transcriptional regulator [Leptolyngbya sp. 15MV]|nr:LuxR C-terminal-related transcriptional regulator [Leptolyngbya sp. 15MV]